VFFEFRQYRLMPGKSAEWVKFTEDEMIPFQSSKGMVIIGSWLNETDPEDYYWLRRFESEAERERLYKAVYEHPTWVNDLGPRVRTMIDVNQIKVTRLTSTPRSVVQ